MPSCSHIQPPRCRPPFSCSSACLSKRSDSRSCWQFPLSANWTPGPAANYASPPAPNSVAQTSLPVFNWNTLFVNFLCYFLSLIIFLFFLVLLFSLLFSHFLSLYIPSLFLSPIILTAYGKTEKLPILRLPALSA